MRYAGAGYRPVNSYMYGTNTAVGGSGYPGPGTTEGYNPTPQMVETVVESVPPPPPAYPMRERENSARIRRYQRHL